MTGHLCLACGRTPSRWLRFNTPISKTRNAKKEPVVGLLRLRTRTTQTPVLSTRWDANHEQAVFMTQRYDTLTARSPIFPFFLAFLVRGTFWRDTYRRLERLVQPGDFLLDIGALDTPYTRYLRNRTIALDMAQTGRFGFSPEYIAQMKSSPNVIPVIASAEALPFQNGVFNKIICTEVIEHILNDVIAITEMARVLDRNGMVFITTPNGEKVPLERGIDEHIRHYTEQHLEALFQEHFEFVSVERRFHFMNVLNLQFRAYDKWKVAGNPVSKLALGLTQISLAWIYDMAYVMERILRLEGHYNICLIARRPKRSAELPGRDGDLPPSDSDHI